MINQRTFWPLLQSHTHSSYGGPTGTASTLKQLCTSSLAITNPAFGNTIKSDVKYGCQNLGCQDSFDSS